MARCAAKEEAGLFLRLGLFTWRGIVVLLCLAPVARGQPPTLPSHRIGSTQCVAVSDLVALYNLGRNLSTAADHAEYKAAHAQIILQADSREIIVRALPRDSAAMMSSASASPSAAQRASGTSASKGTTASAGSRPNSSAVGWRPGFGEPTSGLVNHSRLQPR